MPRLSKIPAKVAFSFCILFCLYSPFVFSQQVDTAWVRRYNGLGNGDDKATAIAVDSSGNVYVTGFCFDSTTRHDYCTIKYLPNGDTAWLRRYDGPGGFGDYAYAIEVDSFGNVYVAGESNGISQDFATIKYYPNGDTAWVRRYNGPGNDNEEEPSLAIDNSGNVYITGRSADVGSVYDYATIKYDSLGNEVWVARYNGPGDSDDESNDIVVDALGNVYVTGRSWAGTSYDYATIKYTPNGDTLWVRRYDGPAGGNDIAYDVAVGLSGSVYVAGSSSGDYATIRYDSIGNQMWVRRFHNLFTVPNDGAFALDIDSEENVYVTGMQAGDEIVPYWATLKYDSAGNQIWWEGFAGGTAGLAIAVGADENAFVAGYSGALPFQSFVTARYGPNGNLLWVKSLAGLGQANAITLDTKGNVYVAGFNVGTDNDYATVKYSPLPQLKGDLNLDGALSTADVVLMLNCTFLGEAPPAAPVACDLNCDGKVTPADVVVLLNMVFLSAPPPC